VGHGFDQFGLEGLVLGVKLVEMRLKAHASLRSDGHRKDMMTQTWGLVELPARA
jgi:hypothetical protein